MLKTKNKLIIAVMVMVIFASFSLPAMAATTDTFQITVTCRYYAIELLDIAAAAYTTWAAGTLDALSTASMESTQGVWASTTAGASYKLRAHASDSHATPWTCSTGAVGEDKYNLQMYTSSTFEDGAPAFPGVVTVSNSPTYTVVTNNITAASERVIYCRLTTPTSSTTGTQHEIMVTIEISKYQ